MLAPAVQVMRPARTEACLIGLRISDLFAPYRRKISATAFGDFGGHAYGLTKGGMRMNGLAYVDRISTHFYGQCNFAYQVASVGNNNTAAQYSMCFRIEQKLGKALVRSEERREGKEVVRTLRYRGT